MAAVALDNDNDNNDDNDDNNDDDADDDADDVVVVDSGLLIG